MINLRPLLKGLDRKSQDAIVSVFSDMERRLALVESRKPPSLAEIKTISRDTAKNENQYKGAQSLSTWHIKDVIRTDEMTTKKTIDLVIHVSGELFIPNDSEVIIGK